MERWGVDPAVLLSDTRILDCLLHNSDRHHGEPARLPRALQGRLPGVQGPQRRTAWRRRPSRGAWCC